MRRRGPRGSPVRLHRRRQSAAHLLYAVHARFHSIERTAAAGDRPPRLLLGGCVLSVRLLRANASRLSSQLAQVIQLGAPNLTAPDNDDITNHGAVDWENALHAHAVRDLANGKRLAHAAPAPRNAHSLERRG